MLGFKVSLIAAAAASVCYVWTFSRPHALHGLSQEATSGCNYHQRCTISVRAVIYDMNGREADEAQIMLDAAPGIEQYIFCSSAGVYLKSDQMPHREEDAVDPKSRHKVRGVSATHVDDLLLRFIPMSVVVFDVRNVCD